MPCAIRNAKGLFATTAPIALMQVEYASKFSEALRASELKEAQAPSGKMDQIRDALAFMQALESLPGRSEKDSRLGSGEVSMLNGRSIHKNAICLMAQPSGWNNGTQVLAMEEAQVRAEWGALATLTRHAPAIQALASNLGFSVANMMKNLPSAGAQKKFKDLSIEPAGADVAARGGDAYAIWMGSPRELGYMDGKKRPAGCANARLFESAAAAARTARAAGFGKEDGRGPAAIVRITVEPIAIEEHKGEVNEVRGELARREAQGLSDALEQASLERLREALGGSLFDEPAAAPASHASSLATEIAGSCEGFAMWRDWRGISTWRGEMSAGFVNQRSEVGPLTGATLHATADRAHAIGWWGAQIKGEAVVRVRAGPQEIVELIGEPRTEELRAVILDEQAKQEAESLAKLDAQALKSRVQALESGEAKPAARRASRL